MNFQSLFPAGPIAGYVSNMIVIQQYDPGSDMVLPLIANSYPGISFQVSDETVIAGNSTKMDNLFLHGQFVKPVELSIKGRMTFITYFFYPHVLRTLFGVDARELTNATIDISLLTFPEARTLKERLIDAVSLEHRLQLIDQWILQLISRRLSPINDAIRFATGVIQKEKGLVPLKQLHSDLHITERTFQRLFESHVGISPRMFSRICQFHAAFQCINQKQPPGLSGIAFEYGYADQSHFIRSFKEFTRYTPSEYLALSAKYRS